MDRREKRRREIERRKRRQKRNRMIALLVIILIIIAVVVIIICTSNNNKSDSEANATTALSEETVSGEDATTKEGETTIASDETTLEGETTKEAVVDVGCDKPVHLYTVDYDTMTCTKVTELNKTWTDTEDLASFGAFATDQNSFTFTSEPEAYREFWDAVNTATNYKIGYELSFEVGDQEKVITILEPADIENNSDLYMGDYPEDGDYSSITGYMGVWVYDDYSHEAGESYIHITQAEVTDDTLLTSIKLRPTPNSDEISNLVLKAFSYSSDSEFDSDGHYIGNYAASVKINNG